MSGAARSFSDDGLGIVEALVAILLFGVLAVALVPPIVAALEVSAESTTIASAGQVAQGQVEEARSAAESCSSFTAYLSTTPPASLTDSRGARYSVTRTVVAPDGSDAAADVSWCDDSGVTAVTFNVGVTSVDTDNPDVADVTTVIAVPGIG